MTGTTNTSMIYWPNPEIINHRFVADIDCQNILKKYCTKFQLQVNENIYINLTFKFMVPFLYLEDLTILTLLNQKHGLLNLLILQLYLLHILKNFSMFLQCHLRRPKSPKNVSKQSTPFKHLK